MLSFLSSLFSQEHPPQFPPLISHYPLFSVSFWSFLLSFVLSCLCFFLLCFSLALCFLLSLSVVLSYFDLQLHLSVILSSRLLFAFSSLCFQVRLVIECAFLSDLPLFFSFPLSSPLLSVCSLFLFFISVEWVGPLPSAIRSRHNELKGRKRKSERDEERSRDKDAEKQKDTDLLSSRKFQRNVVSSNSAFHFELFCTVSDFHICRKQRCLCNQLDSSERFSFVISFACFHCFLIRL